MAKTCYATAKILVEDAPSGEIQEVGQLELGKFHEVWNGWVTIGRDPMCSITLDNPDVPPVAVAVTGFSNHKMALYLPEGQSLPIPPRPQGASIGDCEELLQATKTMRDRVLIGSSVVYFDEVYRDE